MRPRQDQLGPFDRPVHLQQVELHSESGTVILRPHLFRGGQQRLRLPQVDDGLLWLNALDYARDNVAFTA